MNEPMPLRADSSAFRAAVPGTRDATKPVGPQGLRAGGGDALALRGIAHDGRNLVTALRLCSDLLGEAGVLAEPHRHLVAEIRSIADASERLTQRLARMALTARQRERAPETAEAITDLPAAVRHLSGLLAAITGPLVGIEVACLPCRGTVGMTEEDLTRILLHLVRNATDAMSGSGHIRITAQRGGGSSFFWKLHENDVASGTADLWDDVEPAPTVMLAVEDDGPGIPQEWMERIFDPGFSTRRDGQPWPASPHHGLGLSLVRDLVERAGGRVRAAVPEQRGARIEIELPLTNVTPSLLSEPERKGGNEGQ